MKISIYKYLKIAIYRFRWVGWSWTFSNSAASTYLYSLPFHAVRLLSFRFNYKYVFFIVINFLYHLTYLPFYAVFFIVINLTNEKTNSINCLWLKLWDSVHFRKYCYLMDMLSLAWQCCKRNLMKCILGFSQRWLFSMLLFLHSAFSPRCLFSTVAFLHGVVNGKNSYEVHSCLFSTVTHVRISAVVHRVLP